MLVRPAQHLLYESHLPKQTQQQWHTIDECQPGGNAAGGSLLYHAGLHMLRCLMLAECTIDASPSSGCCLQTGCMLLHVQDAAQLCVCVCVCVQ